MPPPSQMCGSPEKVVLLTVTVPLLRCRRRSRALLSEKVLLLTLSVPQRVKMPPQPWARLPEKVLLS